MFISRNDISDDQYIKLLNVINKRGHNLNKFECKFERSVHESYLISDFNDEKSDWNVLNLCNAIYISMDNLIHSNIIILVHLIIKVI